MYGRRRNTEITLHVRFRGRAAVNLSVVIDERQILPLFFCVHDISLLLARLDDHKSIITDDSLINGAPRLPVFVIIHAQEMLHSIAHKGHRGSPNQFHLRSR
jgi:hypothetical protein